MPDVGPARASGRPPERFSRELYSGSTRMSREQAAAHLEQHDNWDYLDGRLLKLSLRDDSFDPWGYDRDNGAGPCRPCHRSPSGDPRRPLGCTGTWPGLALALRRAPAPQIQRGGGRT